MYTLYKNEQEISKNQPVKYGDILSIGTFTPFQSFLIGADSCGSTSCGVKVMTGDLVLSKDYNSFKIIGGKEGEILTDDSKFKLYNIKNKLFIKACDDKIALNSQGTDFKYIDLNTKRSDKNLYYGSMGIISLPDKNMLLTYCGESTNISKTCLKEVCLQTYDNSKMTVQDKIYQVLTFFPSTVIIPPPSPKPSPSPEPSNFNKWFFDNEVLILSVSTTFLILIILLLFSL